MKALNISRKRDRKGRFIGGFELSVRERFLYYVRKTESCWFWKGAKTGHGYGSMKVNGKMISAHRLSYELFVGPLPYGKILLHSCDNRLCVRPGHLKPGTHKDNTQDMFNKNRQGKIDFRKEQLKGAKIKKNKTMNVTLPCVVKGVKKLIENGIKPTQRACRSIPGYNSIQRYIKQKDLITMAKEK